MTTIQLELAERGYEINIGRSLIDKAGEIFNLNRRVLIITDSGVPKEYAKRVLSQCRKYHKKDLRNFVGYTELISAILNVFAGAFLLIIFRKSLMLLRLKPINCSWRSNR